MSDVIGLFAFGAFMLFAEWRSGTEPRAAKRVRELCQRDEQLIRWNRRTP